MKNNPVKKTASGTGGKKNSNKAKAAPKVAKVANKATSKAIKTTSSQATKQPKSKGNFWRWVRYTLVGGQTLVTVMLLVSLISMNILDWWLILIVMVVMFGSVVFNILQLSATKEPKRPTKITCSAVAITCIVVGAIALRYTGALNAFLDKVTRKTIETKEYSVVVLDESDINDVQELTEKNVGFLSTDTKAGNAEEYLQTVVKFDASFYDDMKTMAEVLDNQISTAIVLESDRVQAIEDEEQDLLHDTRVIYTFEIELDGNNVEVSNKKITEEPFVVYISGSDSRHGVKATARSDVNIIAVVNPKQGKILLVSIPRDMYVQLHGTTGLKDKLTHAGIYGIDMSRQTIEDFLNAKIDHTIKVSFDTVVKVVDEIDGIEIDSDTVMKLKAEGKDKVCEYKIGKQKVDGDCALRFARERKSYTTGDRHRGENQQQVIAGIINKLDGSSSYLLRVPTILDIAADSFESTFKRDDVAAMIRSQLGKQTDWKVESISVDGAGAMKPTYSMGANLPLYVMEPYEDSVTNATNKIQKYLEQ